MFGEVAKEHVAARVTVADILRARARVCDVETARELICVISDFKDGVAAFVVDAVREFGNTFLDEFGQEAEVVDVRRHNRVREFVSKRPVEQTRAAYGAFAVNIGSGETLIIFHVDVEHELSCRAVRRKSVRAPIPNRRERV